MNKPIVFVFALLAAVSAQAQNNNFTGAANAPWATAANWSAGVPTSTQNVVSANGVSVRIQGIAAQASNLTIGGATGTSGVQILGNVANSSLTVAGSITLAPGIGGADLNLGFGGGSGATLTIGSGSGSILDGGGGGASRIVIGGLMGTLGLANATADQLLINQTTSGSLTIGAGQNYNILSTQGTQVGSGTANITDALTVNGTLVSRALVVGAAAASGANNATLTLNTGGLLRATDLRRTGSQSTTFNWNGGTIQNQSDADLMVQGTGPNTLTINLAQADTRTFQADSGRTITISNTAVLADKSGENGSLTKTGAGSLLLLGTNTYSGATTISQGSVIIGAAGSIGNSSLLDVSSGATLNVSAVTGGFVVGSSQTLRGSGTLLGNTTINGALQPGSSPGLLSFNNNLTLGSTAATTMEINGAGTRGMVYDAINVGGSLTYNGSLTLLIGTTFGVGNYNFDLFDSVSTSGTFGTVNLGGVYSPDSLTNNGSGVWGLSKGNDTWTFNQSNGQLDLQVVPEPSSNALLVLAAAVLGARVIHRKRVA